MENKIKVEADLVVTNYKDSRKLVCEYIKQKYPAIVKTDEDVEEFIDNGGGEVSLKKNCRIFANFHRKKVSVLFYDTIAFYNGTQKVRNMNASRNENERKAHVWDSLFY